MPKGVLDPSTPQCKATSRGSGHRCKLPAIKGGTVCRRHGGSAPQVQKKARERFNDLVDPMINIAHKLADEAEEGKLTPAERISLIKFIADRTGFVPGKTVNVDGPAKWEVTLQNIIMEVPADLQPQIAPGTPPDAGVHYPQPTIQDIEDADVLEEDTDPRASLPQIRPGLGQNNRAGIVLGSANPPERPGYRR